MHNSLYLKKTKHLEMSKIFGTRLIWQHFLHLLNINQMNKVTSTMKINKLKLMMTLIR